MRTILGLTGFLAFGGLLAAAPVDCSSLTNLQQYIDQNALGPAAQIITVSAAAAAQAAKIQFHWQIIHGTKV